jgi:hypothetical protein
VSGGHFNYVQYKMDDAANEIERHVRWGGECLKPETLARFQAAVDTLRTAAKMLHRVDWLLSDDDGEETFLARWDKDMGA